MMNNRAAMLEKKLSASIEKGRLLRPLSKSGKLIGDELSDWAIWSVVEQCAKEIGIEHSVATSGLPVIQAMITSRKKRVQQG